MNDGRQDKVLNISREEQEARLLSSVILEYNDESQYLARDDRDNLITFGDGQGNKFPIPFPEGEKVCGNKFGVFAISLCMGLPGLPRMVQSQSAPLRDGKLPGMMQALSPSLTA